jgi:hypothetical protein
LKSVFSLAILLLISLTIHAQSGTYKLPWQRTSLKEIERASTPIDMALAKPITFMGYLLNQGKRNQAYDFATLAIQKTPITDTALLDSLTFFQAYTAQLLKRDSIATELYLTVSELSPLYLRARYQAAQLLIAANKFEQAEIMLRKMPPLSTPEAEELRYFLLGGTLLLQGNLPEFDRVNRMAPYRSSKMAEESAYQAEQAALKSRVRKRSPVVAGLLSAAIPGLGKVYAGSRAQGLSAFFQTGLFSYLAIENYQRHSVRNVQFFLFSGLAALFYVGNIFGSVFTPERNYREQIEAINYNVKVSLADPL